MEEANNFTKKVSLIIRLSSRAITDTLFPVRCLGCSEFDQWICEKCFCLIPEKNEQVCPICEKRNTPDGRVCFSCGAEAKLSGLLVCSTYRNPLLSRAIQYYKYRFAEDLSLPLGKIMVEALAKSDLPLPEIIIPVPLHRFRLRWRGFNQSELLAGYVSGNLSPGFPIPVGKNIIERNKFTYPQMKIKNYQDRQKNIQGVFQVEKNMAGLIKEKRILLIDDIATTGATLFECAEILKSAGAGEVLAVVLARQESSNG